MGKKANAGQGVQAQPGKQGGWRGKLAGAWERLERTSFAAAALVPSQRLKMWLSGFFHPDEEYAKAEARATLRELIINLLIFYFIYSSIFFLFMLALTSFLPADDLASVGLQKSPDLAQIAIGSLVASPIISAASALFAFALVFAAAKALGGKGGFSRQSYSMSLVLCGSNLLMLAFMCTAFAFFFPSFLVRSSPLLGGVLSIAGILAGAPALLACLAILLYTIYAYYLVVRKAHGLSGLKSALAIVIAAALVVLFDAALNALLAGKI